ncbi:hypothetical protein D3C87_80900 [compost metagenome]
MNFKELLEFSYDEIGESYSDQIDSLLVFANLLDIDVFAFYSENTIIANFAITNGAIQDILFIMSLSFEEKRYCIHAYTFKFKNPELLSTYQKFHNFDETLEKAKDIICRYI